MRKEVLTKIKCEEEGQRRGKLAAFQPQGFCDSGLERAISVCVCVSVLVCAGTNWADEGRGSDGAAVWCLAADWG